MTQNQTLEILKAGHNVFLTGAAGSGKTFVLNKYIEYLKENNIEAAITASTGIASTHLGGMTLHSWTGLGVRASLGERDIKELLKRGYLRKRYAKAGVIIIDEVSMLHHFVLDMADRMFRAFKQIDLPFGGAQVVLCGDFFQLPPVARQGEPKAQFVYKSEAWQNLDLKICYLDEQHRQKDKQFLEVLNGIRANKADDKVRGYLAGRVGAQIKSGAEATKLYSHNINVDMENSQELGKIGAKEYVYSMEKLGVAGLADSLQKSCLAPEFLRLKVGAKVMFVKNNYEEGYVNGTLGTVERLEEARIIVKTNNGALMDVGPASWHIVEDGEIKAEITQYPLRLAWAITVHKSQGMSLDAAKIDLRESFERGMGYVALSRVRSLAGLSLAGFNDMALKVNEEVLEFDEKLKKDSERDSKGKKTTRKKIADKKAAKGKREIFKLRAQ